MPKVLQTAKLIDGVETEVFLQHFADRVLVLVTQVGKVGSLTQASLPSTIPLSSAETRKSENENDSPELPPAIELTPLLGTAPSEKLATLQAVYVSQIATIVWTKAQLANDAECNERKNVIVGLALRKTKGDVGGGDPALSDAERSTFNGVMGMLQELLSSR